MKYNEARLNDPAARGRTFRETRGLPPQSCISWLTRPESRCQPSLAQGDTCGHSTPPVPATGSHTLGICAVILRPSLPFTAENGGAAHGQPRRPGVFSLVPSRGASPSLRADIHL